METAQKSFDVNLRGEMYLCNFNLPNGKSGSEVGPAARYHAAESLDAPYNGLTFSGLRTLTGTFMSPEAVSDQPKVSGLPSGSTVVLEQAPPPVWREKQVAQLVEQFKRMQEASAQRFATLEQRFDQQAEVIAQLRTDQVMQEHQISKLEQRISELDQRNSKLEQQHSKLENLHSKLAERFSKQEAEIAQLQRDQRKQAGEINSLTQRIEKQEARIDDLQKQCDEKDKTIETLKGSVARLELGMVGVQERINGVALRALVDGARLKMNGGIPLNFGKKQCPRHGPLRAEGAGDLPGADGAHPVRRGGGGAGQRSSSFY